MLTTPWRRACDFLCRKQRREQPVRLVNLVAMLLVLCQLSCKVIGYVDSQTSPVRFDQSFLSQLNSHLFLIKLSVIKLSVIVNFITCFALINDKMHASVCAEDTHC